MKIKGEKGLQELEVGKIYIATKRLINKVWTMTFVPLSDGSVFIINYSRDNEEGYEKERESLRGRFEETKIKDRDRQVVNLLLSDPDNWEDKNTDIFTVSNIKHVFDYDRDLTYDDIKNYPELQHLKTKITGKKYGLTEHFKSFEDFTRI